MPDDEAAARSLEHFMRRHGLSPAQRDLLMSDYASRRAALSGDDRRYLDDLAFRAHLPDDLPAPRRGARMSPAPAELPAFDVAIVTILPVELSAVRTVFGIDRDNFEAGDDGIRYYPATVRSRRLDRDLSIVLTEAEDAYDLNASDAVHALLDRGQPTALFLVGIAAGNPLKLWYGDVVVPRVVKNYEGARLEPGTRKPRPAHENLPREVAINLNHYDPADTGLRDRIIEYLRPLRAPRRPKGLRLAKFDPKIELRNATLGVGAKLIADGHTLDDLREDDERLIAADQDSYGFAHACRGHWWAVFRGISDFGGPDKTSEWQFVAASTAALTLLDFLENEYLPPEARR